VPNFGEILAHNFVQGIRAVGAEMQQLISSGTITLKVRETNLPLSGKSFCFTGELETMKRSQAESLVKQKGGSVKSSVVKDLTFLVTNEPESGSSKNLKAQKLCVNIIDEKTFLQMVES
jgi:DNA ligase